MRVIKMRIKMVIVLIVLVQATNLTPMVGNLLKVAANQMADNNLLKVAVVNLKVEVDNLMADSLMVVVNNHLKVANKNHLVADNLVIHLQRIHKVALK